MPAAVGVIETLGFPAVLAAADAMVKAGAVTLVYFGQAESGRFLVAIRGRVAEVNTSCGSRDCSRRTSLRWSGNYPLHHSQSD